MTRPLTSLAGTLVLAALTQLTPAQTAGLQLPKTVRAGAPFSIATSGSGAAVLYIVGPGHALRRNMQLGTTISLGAGEISNAGHYVVLIVGGASTAEAQFDVLAGDQPATLSFLAKPSRLPVGRRDGISGVVYVFDVFRNLIFDPLPVSFQLSSAATGVQTRTVATKNSTAWVTMNSAPRAGTAQFQANIGNVTEKRVVQQVPGDPCNVRMTAKASAGRIVLATDPVRDCSGNAVPDGTIVTFTESYNGSEATVDVPLKRGVAQTELPAHDGAVISVAAGVVMGNEIRWSDRQRGDH